MYEKYVIARDEAGITDYRVAKDTGISTASLSNWKKNFETDGKSGYKPKADKLDVYKRQVDENSYSPLVLAYIGDSVYEVIIRTKVINRGSMQVNKMHRQSSELVKAGTQAELIKAIEDMLTREEHAVFKRGRNAKSATSAKNASVIDYRMATGMEALVGWLFLRQEYNRLVYLISQGLEKLGRMPDPEGDKT